MTGSNGFTWFAAGLLVLVFFAIIIKWRHLNTQRKWKKLGVHDPQAQRTMQRMYEAFSAAERRRYDEEPRSRAAR